jgi:hypothetical protein
VFDAATMGRKKPIKRTSKRFGDARHSTMVARPCLGISRACRSWRAQLEAYAKHGSAEGSSPGLSGATTWPPAIDRSGRAMRPVPWRSYGPRASGSWATPACARWGDRYPEPCLLALHCRLRLFAVVPEHLDFLQFAREVSLER